MAKSAKKEATRVVYRDSATGKITSKAYALKHPKTTEKQTVVKFTPREL